MRRKTNKKRIPLTRALLHLLNKTNNQLDYLKRNIYVLFIPKTRNFTLKLIKNKISDDFCEKTPDILCSLFKIWFTSESAYKKLQLQHRKLMTKRF